MLKKLTTMLTAFAVALPVSVPLAPAAFGQASDDIPAVIRLVMEGLSPAEAIRNGAAVDAVAPGTLETAMHIAAKRNRLDIARELSGWDVLTNMLDIRGQTALHVAAAGGYQEMAEFLLDEGYDPDIRDAQGRAAIDLTPPAAAALREILAPFFINPNRVRDLETGRTGLHLLALSGTPEQVREALAGDPSRGIADNAGLTPVHLAAQRGDVEVMRALLEDGRQYLAQLGGPDGRNALHIALENEHTDLAVFMVEAGVAVRAQDDKGDSAAHYAVRKGNREALAAMRKYYGGSVFPDLANHAGQVPYQVAREEDQDEFRYLLDPRGHDDLGWTQLHVAAIHEGDAEKTRKLLEWGAHPEFESASGQSVLHALIVHMGAISPELFSGADINTTRVEIARILVEAGADLGRVWEETGTNPLQEAEKTEVGRKHFLPILRGHVVGNATEQIAGWVQSGWGAERIRAEIAENAHLSQADFGELLRLAAREAGDQHALAGFFIESGGDVNELDGEGKNALHHAAKSGNVGVILRLLGKNQNGESIGGPVADSWIYDKKDRARPGWLLPFASVAELARNGKARLLPIMLDIGFVMADHKRKDPDGNSLMHYAAMASSGGLEVVKYLNSLVGVRMIAANGREIHADWGRVNKNGERPWDLASSDELNLAIQRELASDGPVQRLRGWGFGRYAVFPERRNVSLRRLVEWGLDVEVMRETPADRERKNDSDKLTHLSLLLAAVLTPRADGRELDVVRFVLERGAGLKGRGPDGGTALHYAVQDGDEELIQLLLENGARPDIRDNNGATALEIDSPIPAFTLSVMMSGGANKIVNAQCDDTRLHKAAQYLRVEEVKNLILAGADMEARRKTRCGGGTPLFMAIRTNHWSGDGSLDVARALIRAGADVNARAARNNTLYRDTPLHHAANFGHVEMINLLLDAGADPDLTESGGKKPEEYKRSTSRISPAQRAAVVAAFAAWRGRTTSSSVDEFWSAVAADDADALRAALENVNVNMRRADTGDTALHEAVRGGRGAVAAVLLENGADVTIENSAGETPLYVALRNRSELTPQLLAAAPEGALLAARQKLHDSGEGGDENTWELSIAQRWDSALFSAVRLGRADLVQELLEDGVSPNQDNSNDEGYEVSERRALLLALALDQFDAAKILIEHGADVNARGGVSEAETPLQMVVMLKSYVDKSERLELIRALLAAGAQPIDPKSTRYPERKLELGIGRYSPLHYAALQGWTEAVNLLIERGADVDFQDGGEAPLHAAVACGGDERSRGATEEGCKGSVKALLDAGATPWIESLTNGGTPAYFAAAQTPYLSVLELLNENRVDWTVPDHAGITPVKAAQAASSPFVPVIANWAGVSLPDESNAAASADLPGLDSGFSPGLDSGFSAAADLAGAGASNRDELGEALVRIAMDGPAGEMRVLLDDGADPNYQMPEDGEWFPGVSALYAAAMCYSGRNSECLEKAEMLLAAGADINRQLPGLSNLAPIHEAAHAAKLYGRARLGMLLLLLDNGADPRLEHSHPFGANVMRVILDYANIANGFGEDAERMREWAHRLQRGEQGEQRDAERDLAAERERELLNERLLGAALAYLPEHVQDLLDQGADPNAFQWQGPGTFHALHYATMCYISGVSSGEEDVCLEKMRILLEAGADVNALGEGEIRQTPLLYAIAPELSGRTGVKLRAALLLLEHGADPRIEGFQGHNAAGVLKVLAAEEGPGAESARKWMRTLGLEVAAEAPADPNARDEQNRTPLQIAVENKDIDAILALLEAGADPNAQTSDGRSPLLVMVDAGMSPADLRAVVSAGAKADSWAGADYPYAPLHIGVRRSAEVVEALLSGGANADVADEDGYTPMMLALEPTIELESGTLMDVVQVLLDAGSDPTVKNYNHQSALELAEEYGPDEDYLAARRANGWTVTPKLAERHAMMEDVIRALRRAAGLAEEEEAEAPAAPADPNARDAQNRTPLQRALEAGDADLARALLAAGAGPNAGTSDGRRPIIMAVDLFLPVDLLKDMVDAGCDPAMWKYTGGRFAALHKAVAYSPEAVRALLSGGADVNVRDGAGFTPLFWASDMRKKVRSGTQEEIALTYLELGADPAIAGNDGRHPLMVMVETGMSPAGLRRVVAAGANADAWSGGHSSPLHRGVARSAEVLDALLSGGANVNVGDRRGHTPLMLALDPNFEAQSGTRLDIVQALLDAGADPTVENGNKETALDLAERHPEAAGEDVIRALRSAAGLDAEAEAERNPIAELYEALEAGDLERISSLLKDGVDPNFRDERGGSALHLAIYFQGGNPEVVQMLLDAGADPNYQDLRGPEGGTPLHQALLFHGTNLELVQALLDAGADPTVENKDKETALDWAEQNVRDVSENVIRALRSAAGLEEEAANTAGQPDEGAIAQ